MTDSSSVVVQPSNPLDLKNRFDDYMRQRATEEARVSAPAVMASQVAKILAAPSEEEIWDADLGGTIQARDIPGTEVRILDVRVVRSDREFEDGGENKGYYLSMNAVCLGGPRDVLTRAGLKPGADFVLQTGADLIVAKVRSFEARNLLPVDALIAETKTASGNSVLRLTRPPERVVTGHAE